MFKSIRSKLMGGLTAIMATISLGALVALGANQMTASSVESLISTDLTVLMAKSQAGDRLEAVKYNLQKATASDRQLPDVERDIAQNLQSLRMYIDQLRLGASSDAFKTSPSAKILAGLPDAARVVQPTDGAALVEVTKVHDILPAFEASVQNALTAHDKRTTYYFEIDGKSWNLPGYAYMMKSNHARWVAALDESIRYDAAFKGNLDFARSDVGRLLATYKAPDAKLADLLEKLKQSAERVIQGGKQIDAASKDNKAATFDKQRTQSFQRMTASLDQITEFAEAALTAAAAEEKLAMTSLDAQAVALASAFASLDKVIDGRFASAHASMSSRNSMSLAVTAAIVIAAIGFGIFVMLRLAGSITGPIVSMVNDMRGLADGNVDVRIEGLSRTDEIGQMANALEVFRQAAIEKARLEEISRLSDEEKWAREQEKVREAAAVSETMSILARHLGQLAKADLSCQIAAPFDAKFEPLRQDFNEAVRQLSDALITVALSAETMGTGIDHCAAAADDLSRRTEQQAAGLEQTAAALRDLVSATAETTAGTQEARGIVAMAYDQAQSGRKVVLDAVSAIHAIQASAQQISQIIGVIDEIAFQTNLLALNAGVEAARAGDSGRGFGVIAAEVRGLAQRSAEAAREIRTHIAASTTRVDAGVNLVEDTGRALERIVQQVDGLKVIVSKIAERATDQAAGLQEVNTAVNEIDQITQSNAAMVEETTAANVSLSIESRKLIDLIRTFRTEGAAGEPRLSGNQRRRAA